MSDHPMRQVTDEVTETPGVWGSLRPQVLATFDELAKDWESMLGPEQLTAMSAAIRPLEAPRRALDVASGTGLAADLVAGSFPLAHVVAVDLSYRMIGAANAKDRPHVVEFVTGDASALPFADQSFDLVTVLNGLIFAGELARVLSPSGSLAIAFSGGETTPIYIRSERLERVLEAAGFADIRHGRAGPGTWTSARVHGPT